MHTVQVSVLTHNRSKSLTALLASIEAQTCAAAVEITILDNGSSDLHSDAVRQLADRFGARLLRSSRNLFVPGKRLLEDEIFERGTPDVLVRVDDDVVLSPGWLEAVLAVLDSGVAVCGSVEDHNGDFAISGQRHVQMTTENIGGRSVNIWDCRWDEPRLNEPSERVEMAWQRALAVAGKVAYATRHDPIFLMGGEDADYSLRLRQAGHELRVASAAVIKHRTLGEVDVRGARIAENVIPSWRHFYHRWGFLRRSAAAEADMSLEEFVVAVVGSEQ